MILRAKYNYITGQIWPAGLNLTCMLYVNEKYYGYIDINSDMRCPLRDTSHISNMFVFWVFFQNCAAALVVTLKYISLYKETASVILIPCSIPIFSHEFPVKLCTLKIQRILLPSIPSRDVWSSSLSITVLSLA